MIRILVLLGVLAGTARADDRPTHQTARWLAAITGDITHTLIAEPFEGSFAPDECRWCDPPKLDRIARKHLVWNDREQARTLSDATAYFATPTAAGALLLIAAGEQGPQRWRRFADDVLPIYEAYVYTGLITQLVKISVGRERPDVHFDGGERNAESNLSFYSGHTSIAFSIAVASGMTAHRRGYKLEPVIWAVGVSLASATAYFRVAGDRHYLSDVVSGAVAGAAGGYLIPRLTDRWRTSIVPGRSGIALVGSF